MMYGNDDAMIRDYVDRTFQYYDSDRSNSLQINQFAFFLKDWYANMGYPNVNLSQQNVEAIMMQIDNNFDGSISRQELFNKMRTIWRNPPGMPNNMQGPPQQNYMYGQQPPQQNFPYGQPPPQQNYMYGQPPQQNCMYGQQPPQQNYMYGQQPPQQPPQQPKIIIIKGKNLKL